MTGTAAAFLAFALIASDAGPTDEEMIVTPGPISIAELADRSPEELLGYYEYGNLCERSSAYWHLCRLGDRAKPLVPPLVDMLGDPEMRRRAIWLLGSLGPTAAGAIDPAIDMIEAGDPAAVDLAILLGRIGPAARSAVPAIAMLLDEDDPRKSSVVRALLALDPPPSVAVPVLTSLLHDRNSTVRRSAMEELGRMREEANAAFEPLMAMLYESPEDARHAARALALITGLPFAYPGMSPLDDPMAWAIKEVARPWMERNARSAGFRSFATWYEPSRRSYVVAAIVQADPAAPDEEPVVDEGWVKALCRYLATERFDVVPAGHVIVEPAPRTYGGATYPSFDPPAPSPDTWVTHCR